MFTPQAFNRFLLRAKHIPLKFRRPETDVWSLSLAKPPKSSKPSLLQNHH